MKISLIHSSTHRSPVHATWHRGFSARLRWSRNQFDSPWLLHATAIPTVWSKNTAEKKRQQFPLKGLPKKKGRTNSFRCPVFWCVTNAWAFLKQIQKISKLNLSKRHKVSSPFLPNQFSWPTPSSVASPASRDRCFPLPRRLPLRPACAWASPDPANPEPRAEAAELEPQNVSRI